MSAEKRLRDSGYGSSSNTKLHVLVRDFGYAVVSQLGATHLIRQRKNSGVYWVYVDGFGFIRYKSGIGAVYTDDLASATKFFISIASIVGFDNEAG